MQFDELNALIPHVVGEKLHTVGMNPYSAVSISMPGRHQKETYTPGGDAVVMIDDTALGWAKHQFTHDDIFRDVEHKRKQDPDRVLTLMADYAKVVFGQDPDDMKWTRGDWKKSLHPTTFLHGTQVLAVIEHRRYRQHESRGGGRFLPIRFAYGIACGVWTPEECRKQQRRGRPGLDMLEKEKGFDTGKKVLMKLAGMDE